MTQTRETIEAVIFDMDGVIFDSERACLHCWQILAEKYDLKEVDGVFHQCIGTTKTQTTEIVERAYAKTHGAGIAEKLLAESSALFHAQYDGGRLPIKAGVYELFSFLREIAMPIALASSTRKATITAELTEAGLIGYFDRIIGGDEIKKSKPAPDIYLAACREMDVAPAKACAIEDSYNGVRSAHAAGMHTVMVPDMLPPDAEMRSLADHICDDLFAVQAWLREPVCWH